MLYNAGIPTDLDVRKLDDVFGVPSVGSLLEHDAIYDAVKIDRKSHRYRTVLERWRKRLFDAHKIVLVAERGAGYRVADAKGKMLVGCGLVKQSARRLRKASKVFAVTECSELNESDRRVFDHNSELATWQLRTMKLINSSHVIPKLPEPIK